MKIAHQISELELRLAHLEKDAGIGSWVAEFFEDRPTSADLIRGKYFSKANISEIKIDHLILDGKDFKGANFHRSSMMFTKAQGASFKGADMSWVDLSGSVFNGCDFTGVDFRFANLNRVTFKGCSLDGVKLHSLRGAEGVKILNSTITGLSINACDFKSPLLPPLKGVSLKGASFEEATLSQVENPVSCSFFKCDINGITGDILSSKMDRCKIKGLNLTSAQDTLFKGLIVEGKAKLNKGVSLRFSGVQFMGSSVALNVTSSELYGVTFSKCFFSDAYIKNSKGKIAIRLCDGIVDFSNSSFPNSLIEKCQITMGITDMDLSGSQIVNNDLRFTGATGLNVTGANLKGTEVSGLVYSADMAPSDFEDALITLQGSLEDSSVFKGYAGLVKTMNQTKAIKAEAIDRMTRHYESKFAPSRPQNVERLFVFISYLEYIDSEALLRRVLNGPQPNIGLIGGVCDIIDEKTPYDTKKIDILLDIYQNYDPRELSELLIERGVTIPLPRRGLGYDLLFLRVAMKVLHVEANRLLSYAREVRPLFK